MLPLGILKSFLFGHLELLRNFIFLYFLMLIFSAATLPVTLHCVENKNGVDKKISRFMLPIGVTINMDGSALYNAVTTIYLAQVYNYSLDFGKCLAIR